VKKSIQFEREGKVSFIQSDPSELDDRWEKVTDWLARLRVLEGVPFTYLVPFEEMLPNETIRFFHIDRNWLDALVDGAMSAGRIGSEDAGYDAERYEAIMNELHKKERDQRPYSQELWGVGEFPESRDITGGTLTGFLLRSSAVRHWPGIEVSAYHSTTGQVTYAIEDRIPTIRQERLSESVLLCIFNGTPNHVRLQEPYEGIQIGVDSDQASATNDRSYEINLKDMKADFFCARCSSTFDTSIYRNCRSVHCIDKAPSYVKIDACARSGTGDNSVLDIQGIYVNSKIRISEITSDPPDPQDSAFLAIQMLQFPYQQDFEPSGGKSDWKVVKDSTKSIFDVRSLGAIIESKKTEPNPPIKRPTRAQRLKTKTAPIISAKQTRQISQTGSKKSIAKVDSKHGSTEALQTGTQQSQTTQPGLMDSNSSPVEPPKRRGFFGLGRKR